jgi:ketosteroid isomerase-like protein
VTDEKMIGGVRELYEAFNRRDVEALVKRVRPDIELVRPGGLEPIRGVAPLGAWMEPDAFEEQRVEPLDFTVNGNRVLVRQHATARGTGSSIELDVHSCTVLTLDDDGLVARIEYFLPHQDAEAREAAGLTE